MLCSNITFVKLLNMAGNFFRCICQCITDFILGTITLLITIALSPLMLLIYLLLIIWRSIIVLLSILFLSDRVGSISGLDMLFVTDDFLTRPHSALPGVLILEGKPDLPHILEHWTHVLKKKRHDGHSHVYERMFQYPFMWMGYCFWKHDKNFDVQNHIKLVDDIILLNDENLTEHLESLARRPFAPNRPLWDVVIIPNYNSNEEQFLVIARFHHSMADGLSAMKLVLFGSMGLPALPVDIAGVKKPNCFVKTFNYIKMAICGPYVCLKKVISMRDSNDLKPKKNAGVWHFTTLPKFDLHQLRKAKNDLNNTFTAVMLSAISGGFEKYFETETGRVPRRIHALTSTHYPDHPNDRLTNNWTILVYELKLRCASLQERLKVINRLYLKATRSSFPLAAYLGFLLIGLLPKGLVEAVSSFKSSTVVMTNIPGPTIPCTLFEYPILDMIAWIPLIRELNSLGVAIISYNGSVRISLCGEKAAFETIDSLNRLGTLIYEELQSIIEESRKFQGV